MSGCPHSGQQGKVSMIYTRGAAPLGTVLAPILEPGSCANHRRRADGGRTTDGRRADDGRTEGGRGPVRPLAESALPLTDLNVEAADLPPLLTRR
jgi:hypothetical protein